jgi:uncharacterized protein (DUF58 family)
VDTGEPLLSPRAIARLERLALATGRRFPGLYPASHRSLRHGTSLDFADHRPYHAGDDFRRIDYHLYARLGVLALKLFEAEDDLTLRLLVDTSASMGDGKLRQAATAAAMFGWIGLHRRDAVTLHTFSQETPRSVRFRGADQTGWLLRELTALEAGGTTEFAAAARDLLAHPGPRGVTVLVSDLMTSDWMDGLDHLPARGSQVIVVHVLDAAEITPELFGDVDLVDAETGRAVPVSVTADVQRAYHDAARRWLDEVQDRCRYVGASYVRVMTDDDVEEHLLDAGVQAGVLR